MSTVGGTSVVGEMGAAGAASEASAGRAVTDASFETAVLKSSRPVIVEYWAQWCGPCRMVAPVLESIAAEYAGQVELVTMNVDENPATAARFGILHVPTISVFADGQVVRQVIGAKSRNALLREFGDVLNAAADPS
ncbi:MAG TPA: thioredoxin [Streptosporangiaceae bacterium]|jgi:thioredoxin 1